MNPARDDTLTMAAADQCCKHYQYHAGDVAAGNWHDRKGQQLSKECKSSKNRKCSRPKLGGRAATLPIWGLDRRPPCTSAYQQDLLSGPEKIGITSQKLRNLLLKLCKQRPRRSFGLLAEHTASTLSQKNQSVKSRTGFARNDPR